MKKEEVPQDKGFMEGITRELCYALDEKGNYVPVLSAGWEPKTIAMTQAWEVINEQVEEVKKKVLAGKVSPLAYHMEKNMMDLALLSEYSGFSKSTIKKHLDVSGFKKLKPEEINKYAEAFNIKAEDLSKVE